MKRLVAERVFHGPNCGRYRIYPADHCLKTIKYVDRLVLPDFFDQCVLRNTIGGSTWDSCTVINGPDDQFTVEFDNDYKRELAKDLLSKLIALANRTDQDTAYQRVNDCQRDVEYWHDNPGAVEDVIIETLGIGSDYAWIFTGESPQC